MRNPIRLKNFRLRFLPYFLIGIVVVALRRPPVEGFVLGTPFLLVGTALRSWAAGHLVKNDSLTRTGPYAHLRHPLYLGTLLVATGFALILGGYHSLAALAFVWPWFGFHYFPRKELAESMRLSALHGEAFTDYRAAVPALWPRLRAVDTARSRAGMRGPRSTTAWRLDRYSDNNELGTLLAIAAALLLLSVRAAWEGR